MGYEFLCKFKSTPTTTFISDVSAFLSALHPSFRVFDTNELGMLDELFVSNTPKQIQISCSDPESPMLLTIHHTYFSVDLEMGVFGNEAKNRVEKALSYLFAVAEKFALSVQDPQLKQTIQKQDLPRVIPEIVEQFDKILDL